MLLHTLGVCVAIIDCLTTEVTPGKDGPSFFNDKNL